MIKFKLFVEFLLSLGCVFDRIVGDHHIYTREGLRRPIVIVQEKEISVHIIKSNLRTLGIDTKEFYEYIDSLKKPKKKNSTNKSNMFQSLITQAQNDGIQRINVAAVLFNQEGKMLITQRSATKKYLPNAWHIPGGQIDDGETVEEALKREVKEELDLEITEIITDTGVAFDYLGHGDQKSRTLFILAKSQGEITLDHENQAYKYIDKSEINEYLEPFAQEANHKVFDASIKTLTTLL